MRLFAQLAAALETADDVALTYDLDLAFPATFTIDPSRASTGDELATRIELELDVAPAKQTLGQSPRNRISSSGITGANPCVPGDDKSNPGCGWFIKLRW